MGSAFSTWGRRNDQFFYYRYGGNTECNYTKRSAAVPIHYILQSIYYDFPHRLCRWMNVGDACPSDIHCNCEPHPNASHMGGYALDFDYYTLTASNITQYADPGVPRTKLWSPDGKLLTNVFDWERMYVFIMRMADAFPEVKFMMDVRIYVYMYQQVEKKFGLEAKRNFQHHTQGDAEGLYNHNTHTHCIGIEEVNLEVDTSKWGNQELLMAA